jgi:L-threonylcarbamoyladenylate synthase
MLRLTLGAPDALRRAADVVRRGGVVGIPTETVYGLAADPFNADAIRRVFAVKGRGAEKALPLIASDPEQVAQVAVLTPGARRLAERCWPGPLTLILERTPGLPDVLTGGAHGVGIRVPGHEVARALCAACGHPLTATSANRSGQPPSARADDVADALGEDLDALLDAGPTPGGAVSTIVDLTGEPALVRPGAIDWETIRGWLER